MIKKVKKDPIWNKILARKKHSGSVNACYEFPFFRIEHSFDMSTFTKTKAREALRYAESNFEAIQSGYTHSCAWTPRIYHKNGLLCQAAEMKALKEIISRLKKAMGSVM